MMSFLKIVVCGLSIAAAGPVTLRASSALQMSAKAGQLPETPNLPDLPGFSSISSITDAIDNLPGATSFFNDRHGTSSGGITTPVGPAPVSDVLTCAELEQKVNKEC